MRSMIVRAAEVASQGQGSKTAKRVVGGTGLGALIGGVAGGGKGAAIGAGVGAAAGTTVSAATKGKQVSVPSGIPALISAATISLPSNGALELPTNHSKQAVEALLFKKSIDNPARRNHDEDSIPYAVVVANHLYANTSVV
jgi:hypothetical protein